MNYKKVGTVLAIFAVMLLAVGTVHARSAGEPAKFVPATPRHRYRRLEDKVRKRLCRRLFQ